MYKKIIHTHIIVSSLLGKFFTNINHKSVKIGLAKNTPY